MQGVGAGRLAVLFMVAVGELGWSVTMPNADLIRYVFTQGGLFAVLIVVLWSYRRDFTRILDRDAERLEVLTGLVAANTSAMTASKDESVRTNDALHRVSRAIEHLENRLER